jgi:diadenosine tetraphosphatase ApaH/serine/threonine PP2A family protein phosphatase
VCSGDPATPSRLATVGRPGRAERQASCLDGMLALLYDVHGNLGALRAVLDDAGADRFLLGGDYALFGPHPAETVEALRELDAAWIRGNGERWTADPTQAPDDEVVQGAIAACRQALGEAAVAELAGLDEQLVRDGVRYCHGSPVSDVRSFLPQPADDEDELLAGVSERRLVFGHTHLPFRRRAAGGIELVNPGSVGMPFDGDPRAAYALVHDDGDLEHRRVEYDHAASAAAVRDRFDGPWTATVAARIEQARFDAG